MSSPIQREAALPDPHFRSLLRRRDSGRGDEDFPEQPGCRRLRSHRDLRTLLKDCESPFGKARRPLDNGRIGDQHTARRSGVNSPRFKIVA